MMGSPSPNCLSWEEVSINQPKRRVFLDFSYKEGPVKRGMSYFFEYLELNTDI